MSALTPEEVVSRSHCNRRIVGKRRWCIVWGPILWRDKRRVRVPVCARCKKMLGVYA